jgi:hypothetical protein
MKQLQVLAGRCNQQWSGSVIIYTDPDPPINNQNIQRNLDFYSFVTSLYCNLPKDLLFVGILKATEKKNRIRMLSQWYGS